MWIKRPGMYSVIPILSTGHTWGRTNIKIPSLWSCEVPLCIQFHLGLLHSDVNVHLLSVSTMASMSFWSAQCCISASLVLARPPTFTCMMLIRCCGETRVCSVQKCLARGGCWTWSRCRESRICWGKASKGTCWPRYQAYPSSAARLHARR